MTWIKPSFAWMMYRSGYGRKPNQTNVLKIKLGHDAVAELLNECTCKHGGGGGVGRCGLIFFDNHLLSTWSLWAGCSGTLPGRSRCQTWTASARCRGG